MKEPRPSERAEERTSRRTPASEPHQLHCVCNRASILCTIVFGSNCESYDFFLYANYADRCRLRGFALAGFAFAETWNCNAAFETPGAQTSLLGQACRMPGDSSPRAATMGASMLAMTGAEKEFPAARRAAGSGSTCNKLSSTPWRRSRSRGCMNRNKRLLSSAASRSSVEKMKFLMLCSVSAGLLPTVIAVPYFFEGFRSIGAITVSSWYLFFCSFLKTPSHLSS